MTLDIATFQVSNKQTNTLEVVVFWIVMWAYCSLRPPLSLSFEVTISFFPASKIVTAKESERHIAFQNNSPAGNGHWPEVLRDKVTRSSVSYPILGYSLCSLDNCSEIARLTGDCRPLATLTWSPNHTLSSVAHIFFCKGLA